MIGAILTIVLLLALIFAVCDRSAGSQYAGSRDHALKTKLDVVIENTRSITDDVKDTTTAVSTTTVYMAERVVSPVIRVAGLVAGVPVPPASWRGGVKFARTRQWLGVSSPERPPWTGGTCSLSGQ